MVQELEVLLRREQHLARGAHEVPPRHGGHAVVGGRRLRRVWPLARPPRGAHPHGRPERLALVAQLVAHDGGGDVLGRHGAEVLAGPLVDRRQRRRRGRVGGGRQVGRRRRVHGGGVVEGGGRGHAVGRRRAARAVLVRRATRLVQLLARHGPSGAPREARTLTIVGLAAHQPDPCRVDQFTPLLPPGSAAAPRALDGPPVLLLDDVRGRMLQDGRALDSRRRQRLSVRLTSRYRVWRRALDGGGGGAARGGTRLGAADAILLGPEREEDRAGDASPLGVEPERGQGHPGRGGARRRGRRVGGGAGGRVRPRRPRRRRGHGDRGEGRRAGRGGPGLRQAVRRTRVGRGGGACRRGVRCPGGGRRRFVYSTC